MLWGTENYDEIVFNKYKRGLRIWANEFCGRGVLPQEMKTHVRKMTQLSHLGEFKDEAEKETLGNERCYEDDERGCGEQVAYDNPYGALGTCVCGLR